MALLSSRNFGRLVTPVARTVTPKYFAGFIRTVLDRAIDGIGPFPGAALSADRLLIESNGDRNAAIKRLINNHVRVAGAQGLVTNIGGLMTAAAAIPANITGLALVQCHLIAGIAHLRGHHLGDPRVRNAVLACMVGEDSLASLRTSGSLTQTPLELATAAETDPETDDLISRIIAGELVAQVGGKRLVTFVGRRIPLLGGVFGGTTDALRTAEVGKFAANALSTAGLVKN
jgi:hypothetical protein